MPTTITETNALRLYTGMQLAFEQAVKRSPDRLHELSYVFGGYPVRFRIVGNEMARQILRPFSHLKTEPSKIETPQLTVDLWDESETAIRCQFGSINGGTRQTKKTAISSEGRLIGQRLRNVLTFYSYSRQHIISSVVWAGELSSTRISMPTICHILNHCGAA